MNVSAEDYEKANGLAGAAMRGSGFAGTQAVMEKEDLVFNQEAVDEAQSRGSSFMDQATSVANFLNQFNPIANVWDLITNAIYGMDRFGNQMSNGDAWLKAASIAHRWCCL